jgi:hypothetical protein
VCSFIESPDPLDKNLKLINNEQINILPSFFAIRKQSAATITKATSSAANT